MGGGFSGHEGGSRGSEGKDGKDGKLEKLEKMEKTCIRPVLQSSRCSEITGRLKMFSVDWKLSKCLEIKIYLILIPRSLDDRGLIGLKECI